MPEPSILDARLAEIDRRLSLIQSGLAPSVEGWADVEPQGYTEAGPAPVGPFEPAPVGPFASPPPSAPAPPAHDAGLAEVERIIERLHALTAAHERLLASSRELLSAVADSLARS
ncbi:MAG TPA: hypothetical protein VFN87_01595, partial [Solirubrobacteraceae bacterium]|nr:hypothetical protein [Solirubrobacteraceae bacterium]